jgi:hypothetical protein
VPFKRLSLFLVLFGVEADRQRLGETTHVVSLQSCRARLAVHQLTSSWLGAASTFTPLLEPYEYHVIRSSPQRRLYTVETSAGMLQSSKPPGRCSWLVKLQHVSGQYMLKVHFLLASTECCTACFKC